MQPQREGNGLRLPRGSRIIVAMPDLHFSSYVILAGAWLCGTLAWSARTRAPVSRARPDPLDDAVPPAGSGLSTPLIARRQALRVLADVLIGAAVAFAALRLAPVATPVSVTAHGYLAVFAAALGHAWSPWPGFRGGSAIPSLLGGLVVLWPWCMPLVLMVTMAVVLSTGYLIVAVALATLALPVLAWWTDRDMPLLLFCIAAAALVLVRSAPALLRTWRGEESRFSRLRLLQRLRRP